MDVSVTLNDDIGNVKLHHTFNGAAPVGRGWMIMDGNVINESNYDAIHGTGAYDRDQVATSPLNGKTLPNMSNKFAVGTTSTTQNGSTTISSTGLSGHILSVAGHVHKWYRYFAASRPKSFDSGGSPTNLTSGIFQDGGILGSASGAAPGGIRPANSVSNIDGDIYTEGSGAFSQSIKPESIEFLYIIKVI